MFHSFKKKSVPRKVKFGRKFFTHTSIYCHACHKRFAIFLHLLHFCISSLVMMITVMLILIINKLCYCDDDDDDNDRVKLHFIRKLTFIFRGRAHLCSHLLHNCFYPMSRGPCSQGKLGHGSYVS